VPVSGTKSGRGDLVLPQAEVDAFGARLETPEYKKNERDYKFAVHLVLSRVLSPDRLSATDFPALLGEFFERKLDLDQLGFTETERTFIDEAVAPGGVTSKFTNLCSGGFGVNSFIWIPGAIRDGLGEEIRKTFTDLVTSDESVAERVDRFRSALVAIQQKAEQLDSWHENWKVRLPSLPFTAALLMAVDPQRFSPYLKKSLRPSYEEYIGEWPSGTMGEIYEQVVGFVGDVRDALKRQGAPVADLIDAQSFLFLRETLRASRAWMFQANPRYWDIAAAVQELSEMNWTVAQHENLIKTGDRVYIWRSGSDGGVVAAGTILTDPAVLPNQEGEEFIRDPDKFAGEQLRVRLDIGKVLSPPLLRSTLLGHPVLKDLRVLHFANATNFKVTLAQDQALQNMIGAETMTLAERIEQWRDETGYPSDKDTERIAQRETLAEALSGETLDAVIADPEQFELLQFGMFAHNAYGGPGPQSIVHKHLNTGPEAKRRLAHAMRHLIYDTDEPDMVRLDDVLLSDEWRAPGFGESLATKALAVVYPDKWLPLFQTEGVMGKRILMRSPELGIAEVPDLDEMTLGEKIKWCNDALRSVLDPYLEDDPWGQMQFLYWLRDQQPKPEAESSLAKLAAELYVDSAWLEEVVELLGEKGQIIFQGPPGTGKTFVARRLAQHFEELGGGKEIVQFHPSYAYEDFVEGYRPRLLNNQPGFELVEGPLKRLARRAKADKEHKYILVIDELNRGNVAKVFGELYYLLEYRDDRIRLQYAEEAGEEDEDAKFDLPQNLWIIATMNTADRSIALMDAALRRRFYFVDFYTDQPPVSELLERWLKDHDLWTEFGYLRGVLEEANKRLVDREAAVGPSYFLLKDSTQLSEPRVERIWNHAVLPYLEEQLIGELERRKEFQLAALRKALSATPAQGDADAEEASSVEADGAGTGAVPPQTPAEAS
jgi:MoxR-like ATPase